MNRRELLKSAAVAAPIAALSTTLFASKAYQPASAVRSMNLIVDGPFVILLGEQQVHLLAPRMAMHRHTIDQESIEPGIYWISGLRGANDSSAIQWDLPEGADAFRFSTNDLHLTLNGEKKPYFVMSVPVPKQIVALLAREAEIVDTKGNQRSVLMPTTYGFVYDVPEVDSLALNPSTGWNPRNRLGESGVTNLIVATGLPVGEANSHPGHFRAAVEEVKSYINGLQFDVRHVGVERRTGALRGYSETAARSGALDCQLGGVFVGPPAPPL